MKERSSNINVFIAYAREDAAYLEKLRTYLMPLHRNKTLKIWYDGEILPGSAWEEQIKKNLHAADIILLLVSASSLASDYFYDKEMADALERHRQKKTIVVPVILSDCTWEFTELAEIQALPQDGKPIDLWDQESSAYANIVRGVYKNIEDVKERREKAALALQFEEKKRQEELDQKKQLEEKGKQRQLEAEQRAKAEKLRLEEEERQRRLENERKAEEEKQKAGLEKQEAEQEKNRKLEQKEKAKLERDQQKEKARQAQLTLEKKKEEAQKAAVKRREIIAKVFNHKGVKIGLPLVLILIISFFLGSHFFVKDSPNNIKGMATLTSGLKYKILKKGNGPTLTLNDNFTVHFEFWLLDGTPIESTLERDKPYTNSLKIPHLKGWTEALQKMSVGSKWRLVIPPDLAYGKEGFPPKYPPNSTLICEIELLSINN